jgi:hypothetical protein
MIGCDQAQLAVADKTVEQVSEQPHLQTSVSCLGRGSEAPSISPTGL